MKGGADDRDEAGQGNFRRVQMGRKAPKMGLPKREIFLKERHFRGTACRKCVKITRYDGSTNCSYEREQVGHRGLQPQYWKTLTRNLYRQNQTMVARPQF